jgi:Zn finger protein HypA/HybF involved in hydrogenase expression
MMADQTSEETISTELQRMLRDSVECCNKCGGYFSTFDFEFCPLCGSANITHVDQPSTLMLDEALTEGLLFYRDKYARRKRLYEAMFPENEVPE